MKSSSEVVVEVSGIFEGPSIVEPSMVSVVEISVLFGGFSVVDVTVIAEGLSDVTASTVVVAENMK